MRPTNESGRGLTKRYVEEAGSDELEQILLDASELVYVSLWYLKLFPV